MNGKNQTEKDSEHSSAGLLIGLYELWYYKFFNNIKSLILLSEK